MSCIALYYIIIAHIISSHYIRLNHIAYYIIMSCIAVPCEGFTACSRAAHRGGDTF